MPRLDAIERSNADLARAIDGLATSVRTIEAAIGRLAGQHEATWAQVRDADSRATHDRTLIAALRAETADFASGWLRLRTEVKRLEQRSGAGPTARLGSGRALYISRDGSRREDALTVSEDEREGIDLIADLADLPFAAGSVSAIEVSGAEADADPAQLAHWRTLLQPGGTLNFARATE